MQPRIKVGLIVGGIGLVLNSCAAAVFGLCGPLVTLIAGAVAGYITAQQENLPTKNDAAKAGGIAGGITGGLMIIGQLIGGFGVLLMAQVTGAQSVFGTIPSFESDPASLIGYYIGGAGTGICFGLIGAFLAAGAGAVAGYIATPDQPPTEPPTQTM